MPVDELSTVFSALADPTRRAILARLTEGEASVAELAEPFSISQPAVSKHLKVLENAGLISRNRVATERRSRLEAERLRQASEWMDSYKKFWNTRFDRLDRALADYLAADAGAAPSTPATHDDAVTLAAPQADD